ncbi:hypothetical protein LSTR_LSTR013360 [Laodelphax striatellus]|uniref:Uncharacterized protein n=1 Tax=Laodelphax striatellus TaxID=195883 RepID=A0A482XBV8_LAOST|nr:hypothetical protein LSTR_LSTR013360 [Laodelphax striatellus]
MSQRLIMNSYRFLMRVSKSGSQQKSYLQKRYFSDNPVSKVDKPIEQATVSQNPRDLLRNVVYPSDFEKKMLVWGGRYKSVEDVPKKVMFEELYHAKNKCRIKAANIMIVATIIGCLVAIYLGKQARARGETVQKMNLDWHKEINRRMDEEEEKKKNQIK